MGSLPFRKTATGLSWLMELAGAKLESILASVREVVIETGTYQLSEFRKHPTGWGNEKAAKEFVSFIDLESERRLAAVLGALLPDAALFGEETTRKRAELTWVVDPLDGTTNFLSGLDWFSISVALVSGERPLLGFVYRPALEESFYALRGQGAWREARGRIQGLGRAEALSLRNALVCTGTPYRSPDTRGAFFSSCDSVLQAARDIRRMGSAALDLCSVAAGDFQAFWEVDLMPYDVAAALLLLEECGCPYSSFDGSPYRLFESRSIVAGRPGAFEELREIIEQAYAALPV